MTIEFSDTTEADVQDRVCSILASLSLMVDSQKRMESFNGNMHWLYWHELEHQYKWLVFNTLRLLGILTHSDIGSSANADRICERGHSAFEDLICEYSEYFDTETAII